MLLTDPAFIKRLESLHMLARKVLGGSLKADRRSHKKGSGIHFADYSEYHDGDDFRSIDWNIYARMNQLIVKMFEQEEDLFITLLIDLSHSMASKFDYAKQMAAALGYIALNNFDQLAIYGMADRLETVMEPGHGRGRIWQMLNTLENAKTLGTSTRFLDCLKTHRNKHKKPGLVVVISDFFFEEGFDSGLKYLSGSRRDAFCLQIIDPAEQKCKDRGEVRLTCVESGDVKPITITPVVAEQYQTAIAQWNRDLKKSCARREIGLVQPSIDIPFDQIVQGILRRGGLVT